MKSKKTWLSFLLGCMFVFLCGWKAGITTDSYLYDALDYYQAGKSYVRSGIFSFLNYNNTYRGYFFPLLLYVYMKMGSFAGLPEWISILAMNAIYASFVFTVLLPALRIQKSEKMNYVGIRLIPLILTLVFWSDLIFYPLTDLYSFGVMLLAIKVVLVADNEREKFYLVKGIVIGILLYLAYNIRPIYLLSAFFLGCILLMNLYRKKRGIRTCVFLLCIMIGVGIAAYPQLHINRRQHNRNSIAVITEDLNGGELFTSQLYMGFLFDRYETYVGDADAYPNVPMNFIDKAGVQIISNEKISGFADIGEYIKTVLKYPIDYIGIMIRHIVSTLYMPWNHVYIYNLNSQKMFWMFFNYLIVFLFGLRLIVFLKSNSWNAWREKNVQYLLSIVIPCIAILFGAVEMRFFMPVYAFMYLELACINWKEWMACMKKKLFCVISIFIISFCVLTGFWGEIMSSAQDLPLLMR